MALAPMTRRFHPLETVLAGVSPHRVTNAARNADQGRYSWPCDAITRKAALNQLPHGCAAERGGAFHERPSGQRFDSGR